MYSRKKKLWIILPALILLAVEGSIDFRRVNGLEKPVFCIASNVSDNGGSAHDIGIEYSFDIEGNFLPEDEFPGVAKWTYYLCGKEIQTGIRD